MSIETHSPHVELNIGSSSATLTAYGDSLLQSGMENKISDILKKRQRFFTHYVINSNYLPAPLVAIAINIKDPYESILMMLAGLMWYGFGFFSSFNRYSIIIPLRKSTRTTFFQRNKDQLLATSITGVVSAALGGLLVFFVTQWLKN